DVVVARGPLLVGLAAQQARLDERVEALGEHGARHVQPRLEVVEAADAEQGVAQDQQRPALADDLEAGGDPAVLLAVGAGQHRPGIIVSPVTGPYAAAALASSGKRVPVSVSLTSHRRRATAASLAVSERSTSFGAPRTSKRLGPAKLSPGTSAVAA